MGEKIKVRVGEECTIDHSSVWERFKRGLFREKSEGERIAGLVIYCVIIFVGLVVAGGIILWPLAVEAHCTAANWTELPSSVEYPGNASFRMIPQYGACDIKIDGPSYAVLGVLS
jgi:hypothetical protein